MAKLDRNAAARQVARAEAYFKSNQGRHRPLALSALRLFKLLVFLARKGKHTPTLGWLAETAGLSKSTVQRALRALGKLDLIIRRPRSAWGWLRGRQCRVSAPSLVLITANEPAPAVLVLVRKAAEAPTKATEVVNETSNVEPEVPDNVVHLPRTRTYSAALKSSALVRKS